MKNNTLITLLVLLAIAGIGWMVYRQQKAKAAAAPAAPNVQISASVGGTAPPSATATVSTGTRVKSTY